MKAIHTNLDPQQDVIVNPIYMSREQWETAVYIPLEIRSRIIIVDFVEDEDEAPNNG